MKTTPKLELVITQKETPPYNELRELKTMELLRARLLASAARYVSQGKRGKPQDRMREASDITGIPRVFIETEVGRKK